LTAPGWDPEDTTGHQPTGPDDGRCGSPFALGSVPRPVEAKIRARPYPPLGTPWVRPAPAV